MADDYKLRSFRSNDPHRRAAEPARPVDFQSSSDPLAELARLIGQSDPLADYGRSSPREQAPRGYTPASAAPEWPPQTSRRYETAQRAPLAENYPASADYAQPRGASRDARDAYASSPDYAAQPSLAPQAPRDEGQWAQDQYQDQYQDQHYDDMHSAPEEQGSQRMQAAAASDEPEEMYYQDDAPLGPQDEEMYDDAPSAYRRGGIATVLALVGCALLGTAGAYAYRSYSGHPGVKEPPPVITADKSTPKVAPAPAAETRSNKPISERFANASTGNEQLVSRQEEPVALRDPATATTPRVVLPAPVQPAPAHSTQQSAPPAQSVQPPATTQAPAGGEPKKVRTVTIRPEGSDPSGRPVTNTTPPAPRATAPRATAPARQGGPLSLDPQGEPPAPPARSRTATAPAPREPSGNSSLSGGYVVQLSSQKSETEAHASFRAMQARYPIELGNRQPIIRRADLGAKGVVYRTNVGPFSTAQEANQFCANYKAAGGQCIVPTR